MFFNEIALLLLATMVISLILHLVKQPLVISYIVAGILVGPQVLGWLHSSHELEIFSQAGIVFLLFIVGLHLNPAILKEVGSAALITGIGQILFTSAIGYLIAITLGFTTIASLFIAIALTFSSTIIIMKLISDKKELEHLYSKISIGFLLIQDLVATLILIAVPLMSQNTGAFASTLLPILASSVAVIILLSLVAKFIMPHLLRLSANSGELLLMLAIAWGLGVAALLGYVGLSLEVGALLAGILLSTSTFAEEIASRMRPIRDFFLVTFFILLGSQLQFSQTASLLAPALILSAFVLIGNPLIVYILMKLLGYSRKVSFKSGLTVAQISEFSLILIATTATYYQFPPQIPALVTLVGLITISVSTYMILYADNLYQLVEPLLKVLPLPSLIDRSTNNHYLSNKKTVLWFGVDPIQDRLSHIFKGKKYQPVFIDYDPNYVDIAKSKGRSAIYGDASNVEFLSTLDWASAHAVISLIPNDSINTLIIEHVQGAQTDPHIIVTARNRTSAKDLYKKGAKHVVLPFHLSTDHIETLIH